MIKIPLTCQTCGRADFRNRSGLTRHELSAHIRFETDSNSDGSMAEDRGADQNDTGLNNADQGYDFSDYNVSDIAGLDNHNEDDRPDLWDNAERVRTYHPILDGEYLKHLGPLHALTCVIRYTMR
jgi:hypothetical protein